MKAFLLFAFVLFGCSLKPIDTPKHLPNKIKAHCVIVDEKLQDMANVAAIRWWNALGIKIEIVQSGHACTVVKIVPTDHPRLKNRRAVTRYENGRALEILITRARFRAGEQELLDTMTHEFGHMIGFYQHTSSGIMQTNTLYGDQITKSNVIIMCEVINCLWQRPE